ncbi:SpoIIE family protein phosphatase [Streptomyces sp. NPDC023838]|uniref:SpoIIE family protein phosphatase n=1 Tax=Streptomyces sp. NPDC023838 TaxID=3154325 RepID=UPI0033F520AF
MNSDSVLPGEAAAPDVEALARVVARLRSEIAEMAEAAATTAVLERAKGVLMGQAGLSADAAYEELLRRADERGRTLIEECWITLGGTGAEPGPPAAGTTPGGTGPGPGTSAAEEPCEQSGESGESGESEGAYASAPGPRRSPAAASGDLPRPPLARLAHGLSDAGHPDDVAELLLTVLADATGVDGVMIYRVADGGSLELVGSAGIDKGLAGQWRHIPPLGRVAPLEAIAGREAVWLEDPERDAASYQLIGDPPERWASRAWIPVPGDGATTVVVGCLRTGEGPFAPRTRSLLQEAVRLCAEPLHGAEGALAGAVDEEVEAVQTILDALSSAAILLTPLYSESGEIEDYRIDAAAPASVDVAGRSGKELVGRRVLETYPTVVGTALWEGYQDALITGTLYEGEPFVYREVTAGVPQESLYSVRACRLGRRLVVSWVRHDSSARETRRLADMQRLGNLGWAEWNVVTGTMTWSDQVYAIFGRDPSQGPTALEDLPHGLVSEDVPTMTAAVRRLLDGAGAVDQPFRLTTADGVRHLRFVAEAQTDADGAAVEVYGFFQDLTVQRGAELALRESERAALVQRGILQAERALAARLQHALLPIPEQSLRFAGVDVDVAYVPSESGVSVGGDWYSAIELPDKSALFVVGDVAGHGLDAVATMAQLRFTAKGMAITGSPLPDVLARLNALLLHMASGVGGATATMIMARYQPWDHRLTWVRAGHLPPLLVRRGEARFLPLPRGPLLGAVAGSTYEQSSLDLEPGDHLLLYTDGLVEEPGEDIDQGLARLAAGATRLLGEGPADTLAHVLAARREGRRDDICVLDVHLAPQAPSPPAERG